MLKFKNGMKKRTKTTGKTLKAEKPKRARRDFAQRLAERLRPLGDVEAGALGDNSGRWVSVKSGKINFCFSFDMKGETIDKIAIYRDIWAKVDEEKILEL